MKSYWFSFTLTSIAILFVGLLCLHLLSYPSVSDGRFEILFPVMNRLFTAAGLMGVAIYSAWGGFKVLRKGETWIVQWAPIGLLVFIILFRTAVLENRWDLHVSQRSMAGDEPDVSLMVGLLIALLLMLAVTALARRKTYSAR